MLRLFERARLMYSLTDVAPRIDHYRKAFPTAQHIGIVTKAFRLYALKEHDAIP